MPQHPDFSWAGQQSTGQTPQGKPGKQVKPSAGPNWGAGRWSAVQHEPQSQAPGQRVVLQNPKGSPDLTVWVRVEGQTLEQMLILKVLKQSYGHYYVLETSKTVGGTGADAKGIQEEPTSRLILEGWALRVREMWGRNMRLKDQKWEAWTGGAAVCPGNRSLWTWTQRWGVERSQARKPGRREDRRPR